jgi:hypothetical protein
LRGGKRRTSEPEPPGSLTSPIRPIARSTQREIEGMTSTKVVIMFPYSGYDAGSDRERLFWSLVECSLDATRNQPPLVVLNRDTERRGKADSFLGDARLESVEVYKVWSVDTCQMWLAGWGYVIDNYRDVSRIVQLPGDIDAVSEPRKFFNDLQMFIALNGRWDIIIGDFGTDRKWGAKDLIDQYGTYPLLANWFPQLARAILEQPLNKPRSEFLNIRIRVLENLLDHRKFAYEQTLNLLIRSWDFEQADWKYDIKIARLGVLHDDRSFRKYRACLDQIERTERMLKLLWREIYEPSKESQYQEFIDQYHRLDQISTSMRENARIAIRVLHGIGLD